jgi:glycosyltransferase involved in cell wall biosynthesis
MYTPIETILHKINQSGRNRRLNILSFPTHEGYQTMLGALPHNFYLLQGPDIKTWDFHTKPLPANHYLLHKPFPPISVGIEIDILFSQDRFGSLQRMIDIHNQLKIPILSLDHALPHISWNKKQMEDMKNLRVHKHVYVANKGKEMWGGKSEDKVIYYGLDSSIWNNWNGQEKNGISIVNQFATRDVFCGWNLWQEVAKQVSIKLVGENPGLSTSAQSTEHLISMMQNARFFLNTSQYSTFPMTVAEAMAIGCPVISTSKFEVPLVIEHGKNGFLADSPEEIIKYCKLLLEDFDLAQKIGNAGRETAVQKFAVSNFIEQWNNVLWEVVEENR